jgi:archaeal flagellar protein FlaJ
MSAGMDFILFMLLASYVKKETLLPVLLMAFPVMLFILFFYFFNIITVKIHKLEREINKEIIFAGRFLIIELESGVPLYNAMQNIGKSYKVVGAYFREIIDKVNIGTPFLEAINEAVELVPSDSLRKILWQMANSLQTGSDVTRPLKNVMDTLIREQQIDVAEYGRKLNPLAMFYMLIAIIIPSLGITLITIISIFVGLRLNLTILLSIVGLLGFVQFMFITIISSSRPPVEF